MINKLKGLELIELHGLNNTVEDLMTQVLNAGENEFVLFSDPVSFGNGEHLRQEIERLALGTVIVSETKVNPNTNREVVVYLFRPDYNKLRSFLGLPAVSVSFIKRFVHGIFKMLKDTDLDIPFLATTSCCGMKFVGGIDKFGSAKEAFMCIIEEFRTTAFIVYKSRSVIGFDVAKMFYSNDIGTFKRVPTISGTIYILEVDKDRM